MNCRVELFHTNILPRSPSLDYDFREKLSRDVVSSKVHFRETRMVLDQLLIASPWQLLHVESSCEVDKAIFGLI